jgi:hypothetical protein
MSEILHLCNLLPFAYIYLLDFEFYGAPGDLPTVVCLVIRELRSGMTFRYWQDELRRMSVPPFPVGSDAVFIAMLSCSRLASSRQRPRFLCGISLRHQ